MEAAKNNSSQSQEKVVQSPSQQPSQNQQQASQSPSQQPNQKSQSTEQKKESRPFRIGIIADGMNDEDILYYNKELKAINKLYRDRIRIVVMGYKNENDKLNMLDGVIFEYVKPVSIIHFYKQLASLQIDLLFIPLINNVYNQSSEDSDKYLNAGAFRIPVIAPDMYPYHTLISDEVNGFIFGQRENFIPYLRELLHKKLQLIRTCGLNAQEDVKNFNYSKDNIDILSSAFV